MMKLKVELALLLLLTGTVWAVPPRIAIPASPAANNPWLRTPYEKARKMPECMVSLSRETFLNNLLAFQNSIEHGDNQGKQLRSSHYMSFKNSVLEWTKLRFFECDTDISKKWLMQIAEIFQKMYEYNQAMDSLEAKGDQRNFEVYHQAFKKLQAQYTAAIRQPGRPSQAVIRQLEEQKMKEQKAYRAYLKSLGRRQ
ncbi:MAG: hypothetical protein PHQ27_00645 [Victivallales bacterium]|nr:hypothetical protein [Victivallales bacterium]